MSKKKEQPLKIKVDLNDLLKAAVPGKSELISPDPQ